MQSQHWHSPEHGAVTITSKPDQIKALKVKINPKWFQKGISTESKRLAGIGATRSVKSGPPSLEFPHTHPFTKKNEERKKQWYTVIVHHYYDKRKAWFKQV